MKPLTISTLHRVQGALEALVFDMCRAINAEAATGQPLPNTTLDCLNQIDALMHCVIARCKMAKGETGKGQLQSREPDILTRLQQAERRLLTISDCMNSDADAQGLGFFRRDQLTQKRSEK